MRRRGALTEEDRIDWARFTRSIAPLPGRPVAPPIEIFPPAVLPPRPETIARRPGLRASPPGVSSSPGVSVGGQPAGIDTGTWQRFRGGKLAVVRRLDLHGMTAQRAFHALFAFLRTAHADRLRCVEVVTGRGSGETGGVIRREFPMWLNLPDIRPMVLAAAHPHAANQGSVRLLLRRVR